MNWDALKSYKCPACSSPLKDIGYYHACTKCIFSINKEKFNSVVEKKYTNFHARNEEQNAHDLNNLGHKKVRKDFSDSEALDY